jgi:hypothetical protein
MCVVNSKALAALQGKVGSEGLDEKHGHLKERALERALEQSRPTIQEMAVGLERSTLMAHRLGVTSVHDIINRHKLQAYGAMYAKRALGVRAYLHFEEPDLPEMAKLGISTGYGTHFLRAGGIKLYADGSFGARTAALSEPYYDDRTTKGELLHDAQKLRGLIRAGEKAGLQMLVHAIGDLAVSQAVSSYAMALMKPSRLRHRIEHLELVDDDSLAMMRRLCVWASMQPNFVGEWGHPGGMMASRLGTRYERADAMKRVLGAGIPLIFGSDCMPFSPLYGIHSTVNAPFKDQRLTAEEALKAYTATAAAASFEEDFKGSLTPERAADMVILGANPLEQPGGIKDITVDATVLAGKFVWKRPGTLR